VNTTRIAEVGLWRTQVEWLPAWVGLLAMYVPTFYFLANGIWQGDDNAHGPIVLLVSLYFFWRGFAKVQSAPKMPSIAVGSTVLILGVLCYVLGRSQELLLLEVGSQIPVIAGLILIARGTQALKAIWFPIVFLVFMIPLPGFIVDSATGPLKQYVSLLVEHGLYVAGYPIARSGVVLSIGQYQLLVADACSGLHSMFSLSALGVLYLYMVQRRSAIHNILLLLSIWPIAFLANVIRVAALVLITYYFGDEAGQGFLHEFAGMILFVVALGFLVLFDEMLSRIIKLPRVAANTI